MKLHGYKKQKGQAQRPHIAPDDLVSTSYANILYGLAEGEIMGLSGGGKSIKLDDTPLINDNGQPNFTGVNWDFRTGTLDQSHIAGFPAVENEQNIGVELRSDRPFVRAINNRELSAVRVRLNFNALREQDADGNIKGYAIEYAIDVQTDGGSFQEVLRQTVRGKSSQGYKKSHRIDLPNAGTAKRWTIRVRRITPNRNSDLIADTVHIDALTEIIDAKLAYPCTALLGLSYDAKTFSNIAKLAVRLKGKIIQVPSNYNAQTRQYNGLWDGTFKLAYSNNPAWVFYDLCTHKRYGLGERLSGMVDKWRLYQIGQYCDEMVDDGKGGKEPRFTCNVYIQKADDAYRVLQNLASVFRGLSFWDGSNIVVDSDTPKEPVYTFSPANVVGGEFAYTGTRARDRRTLAKVAWDNPENSFNTEYELIPDEGAIARYGVKVLDIAAFGCTSQGQAQRAGLWALKAEQLETQTVSFKTGLQGFIPQVGQVINVADNVFAGRAISGKIVALSTDKRQITLDRVAGKVGDMLTVNGATGVQSAKITAVRGQVLTLDKAVNAQSEHIWAVISDDLKLKQFRILTIAQNDDATFDITALEYNAQKYKAVDNGAIVTPQPYTVLNATPITAPKSVSLTASTRTVQGQAVTTLTINWEQVQGAVSYIVKWRKDDGNWQTLPKVSGQSVDIDGVYAGKYLAQVQAVDAFDNESLATTSQLTAIAGKTGKPPRLARLVVKGVLFGMELVWIFNAGSDDTNFTEIQVSPDGRSNITTLGTFAYPTNKHEITGLQGNLTQYYRARIVDKLGNTSDWTAWVSGTTEARADKVLDILSGQISQSHLDQNLRTPIAKIGWLESTVNGIGGKIPTIETAIGKIPSIESTVAGLNSNLGGLNSQLATAQNELNTAKSTLQTAVGNITTERNRINNAVRDITALQTANNAKTQELANLTQTVGGHTSSIRELGVTTGDLSQKYLQLKTKSDNYDVEIKKIQQTTKDQAIEQTSLKAKFDSFDVGGRNLLKNSSPNVSNADYSHRFELTTAPNVGDEVVVTLWGDMGADRNGIGVYNTQGYNELFKLVKIADGVYQGKGTWKLPMNGSEPRTPNDTHLNVYFYPNTATSTNRIDCIKLERGNVSTDWTPAPEDLEGAIRTTANALIDEYKESRVEPDRAVAQRIGNLETELNKGGTGIKARLATSEKAISDNERALSQRISALDSSINSPDGGLSSRVASAERAITQANKTIAEKHDQLTARFDSFDVGGRNHILSSNTDRVVGGNNRYFIYHSTLDSLTQPFVFSAYVKDVVGNNGNRLTVTLADKSDINNTLEQRQDVEIVNGRIIAKFDTPSNPSKTSVIVYANSGSWNGSATGSVTYYNAKLEKGNVATDWTPAPEDVDGKIQETAQAKIDEYKTSRVEPDRAVAQRIGNLETELNTPTTGLKARLTKSESTLTDLNRAFSESREQLTAGFSDLSSRTTITDTRNDNQQPQWYWTNHAQRIVNEFKSSSVLGLVGFGSFANLETRVYWRDSSGGNIIQTAYHQTDPTKQMQRQSVGRGDGATWSDWQSPFAKVTDDAAASLDEYKQVVAKKDEATAKKLTQLESGLGTKANASALTNYYTKAEADSAISGRVERFEASLKRQEINAVTDLNTLTTQGQYFIKAGNNPNAPAANWLFVDVETSNDKWIIMQSVRQDNNAKNQWVRQRHNGNWSAWEKTATGSELNDKANATALNELSTRVTQVDGKITAESQKISTLQTTLNGQSASIQQHAQTLNGLSAQWTLKVQSGNVVSGIGLASNNGVSDFAVRADKFYIASPTGQKGDTPFVVLTSPQVMNGVRVPAGTYIRSAFIADGSIDNAKIAQAAIDNAKIKDGAINNAKIENGAIDTAKIRDGVITTAKIGTAQVDTLQIAGGAVTVPRAFKVPAESIYHLRNTERILIKTTTENLNQAVLIGLDCEEMSYFHDWKDSTEECNLQLRKNGVIIRSWRISSTSRNIVLPLLVDYISGETVYELVVKLHSNIKKDFTFNHSGISFSLIIAKR